MSAWYGAGGVHGARTVAFGGGHGLYASLSALRHLTERITAVVTVADDGGSSGRLRAEMGVLPPGDLRMALAALCDDREWGRLWRDVMQHRFTTDGPLDHHAMGNLLIVALWELLDDPVAGLDWIGRLLGARGRVLPMSLTPLEIEADVQVGGVIETVRGQSQVATMRGRVDTIRLVPPDAKPCSEAIQAIEEAEWIVLGPGSWFTSLMPHLLLPDLANALNHASARRCLVLNLGSTAVETAGMRTQDLLTALHKNAPKLRLDVVLADPSSIEDIDVVDAAVSRFGAKLVVRQVSTAPGSLRHDPLRLAAALRDAFEARIGDLD